MRLFALFLFTLVTATAFAEDVTIRFDRSWGLLVGDQIQATIHLPVDSSHLEAHSLPQVEKRYGPWLQLLKRQSEGTVMTLTFQIINVPAQTREVQTPEIELRTEAGEFLTVPATTLELGSFLSNADGSQYQPRADAVLPPQSHQQLLTELWIAIAVLFVAILIWLAWHFGLRPRHRLPFATAVFELNKMRFLGRKNADEASRQLHHAFNRSAGRVLVKNDLSVLWQKCPWLEPLADEIEHFYQQSASHFFSREPVEQAPFSASFELAKKCRAKEKMA